METKPKNLSQALDELENFTKSAGSTLKNKLHEELSDLQSRIDNLKPKLDEARKRAQEKVETQVKENPWAAVGIVGLIFFVLGFLLAKRRSD